MTEPIEKTPQPTKSTDRLIVGAKVVGELMGEKPQVAAGFARKCAETIQQTVIEAKNAQSKRPKTLEESAMPDGAGQTTTKPARLTRNDKSKLMTILEKDNSANSSPEILTSNIAKVMAVLDKDDAEKILPQVPTSGLGPRPLITAFDKYNLATTLPQVPTPGLASVTRVAAFDKDDAEKTLPQVPTSGLGPRPLITTFNKDNPATTLPQVPTPGLASVTRVAAFDKDDAEKTLPQVPTSGLGPRPLIATFDKDYSYRSLPGALVSSADSKPRGIPQPMVLIEANQVQSTPGDNPANATTGPVQILQVVSSRCDQGEQDQSKTVNTDDATPTTHTTRSTETLAYIDSQGNNRTKTASLGTEANQPRTHLQLALDQRQGDSFAQTDRRSFDRTALDRAIDQSFDRLTRVELNEKNIPGGLDNRVNWNSVALADAAPGGKSVAESSMLPGGMRDTSSLVLGRENNSATAMQGLNLGQLSGLYINDKGIIGQGALSVREGGGAAYVVDGKSVGAGVGNAALGMNGQGLSQIGEGIQSGKNGSIASTPTGVEGVRQTNAVIQQGQGVVKGVEDTSKLSGLVPIDGRIISAPTDKTTKPTEGISVNTAGNPLLITPKGGNSAVAEVVDDKKLPGDPATTQPTVGLGVIAAANTTTTTQTTTTKDPNTQNTTQTTATGTTPTKEDWENSLPEIDIIDTKEQDNIEPVQEKEPPVRKEICEIDDDDDDDDQFDQFVANDGKRGGGAYTPQSRSLDTVRGLVEIIIADKAGNKLDDTKANQLFTELFGDNIKRQYIVKPGDTIEEIALRLLKDKRLIPLLMNVNEVAGTNMNVDSTDKLQNGLVLQLPTRSQILRYKIHVLNDSAPLMVYANTLGDSKHGIWGSEEQGEYIAYTCRLGDTLKSIAKRHPAIADESKWVEIAGLNEFTTQCDKNGEPVVELTRGQKIYLPQPKAIVDELEDDGEADSEILSISNILASGGYAPGSRRGACNPPLPQSVTVEHDGQTVPAQNILSLMGKMKSATTPLDKKEIAAITRVVTQNDLGDDDKNSLSLRLEMQMDDHWLPVVEYDINTPESGKPSGLKVYDLYGVREVITLGLPTRAARELAENDITVNSQRYCELFIKNHQLAA